MNVAFSRLTRFLLCICLTGIVGYSNASLAKEEENKVDEKVKQTTAQIEITGVDDALADNIRLHLSSSLPKCDVSEKRLSYYKRTAEKKIKSAGRALGYFDIALERLKYERKGTCWLIKITVSAGEPVRVNVLDIEITGEGATLEAFQKLKDKRPYELNDVLDQSKYEAYKGKWNSLAREIGFLEGKFDKHRIEADLEKRTAAIRLHFNTGVRYHYSTINIQQCVLDDDYLQRFMILQEGKVFSSDDLVEQHKILRGSEYYSEVKVRADYQNAKEGEIPVKLILKPNKPNVWRLKVGYGTDTGFRLRGEYKRLWVNRRGHIFNANVQLSELETELAGAYTIPLQDARHERFHLTGLYRQEQNDDVKSQAVDAGMQYTRLRSSGWLQTASLTYLLERTEVTNEPQVQSKFFLLGANTGKTVSNDKLYPSKGWKVNFDLKGGHEALGSDHSVFQSYLYGKYIQPLGQGRLLTRLEVGTTVSSASLDQLPKSMRFFAGGDRSVRGFGFESLGERNNQGSIIGGSNLLVSSVEYEYPLSDSWGAAVFVDAGNAFNTWTDSTLKVGAGVGARWRSPIGPVRVDVAVPVETPDDPRLHITIGPDL